jgi:hypothetical protein
MEREEIPAIYKAGPKSLPKNKLTNFITYDNISIIHAGRNT